MLAPNDIPAAALDRLLDETDRPERLQDLVVLSRQHFGWFTKHEARSLEYPWMAERCAALGARTVADIGAGVSPLPLWLAARGVEVTTIDYHSTVQDLATIRQANEWGFLDYSALDARCRSLNADAGQVRLDGGSIDVVLSVSVVEHMPADVRRRVVANSADWQAGGGHLLLTVDVVPGSDRLWNLDRGQQVEPEDQHGTFGDMLEEIETSGYAVVDERIHRWATSERPADIGFIEAVRT